MPNGSQEIDEIRRQMAKIRMDLHQDVVGVVASAEAATDWRSYVRKYPWISVGLALGVGYLLWPKRHRSIQATVEAAANAAVEKVRESDSTSPAAASESQQAGLIGWGIGLLTPIAIRAAQSYAAIFLENWIASKLMGDSLRRPPGEPSNASQKEPSRSTQKVNPYSLHEG